MLLRPGSCRLRYNLAATEQPPRRSWPVAGLRSTAIRGSSCRRGSAGIESGKRCRGEAVSGPAGAQFGGSRRRPACTGSAAKRCGERRGLGHVLHRLHTPFRFPPRTSRYRACNRRPTPSGSGQALTAPRLPAQGHSLVLLHLRAVALRRWLATFGPSSSGSGLPPSALRRWFAAIGYSGWRSRAAPAALRRLCCAVGQWCARERPVGPCGRCGWSKGHGPTGLGRLPFWPQACPCTRLACFLRLVPARGVGVAIRCRACLTVRAHCAL